MLNWQRLGCNYSRPLHIGGGGGGGSLNGCSIYPNHTPLNVYTVLYSLKCLHDASHRSIDKPPAS